MTEIKTSGQITFDPECVGKTMPSVVLVGELHWPEAGGDTIEFRLLMDYHFCYAKRTADGYESIWAVSRPVADRAKYPNWPKPEPAAVA